MDVAGILEPQMNPRLSAINGLIQPVACRLTVARVTFAGAHPDNVRGFLEDGHGSDGMGRLLVEDRCPINAAGGRFPKASRRRTGIDHIRLGMHGIERRHAAAHTGRSNVARLHGVEERHVKLLRPCLRRGQEQKRSGNKSRQPKTSNQGHDQAGLR